MFLNKVLSAIITNYTVDATYSGARTFIIIGISIIVAVIFSKTVTNRKSIKSVIFYVEIDGNSFELEGLCDSGNLLKEPFSGRAVILVAENSKLGIAIKNQDEIKKRYIPFKNTSDSGVIKGIIPRKIVLNNSLVDAVLATTKNNSFNGYDALVPEALL